MMSRNSKAKYMPSEIFNYCNNLNILRNFLANHNCEQVKIMTQFKNTSFMQN